MNNTNSKATHRPTFGTQPAGTSMEAMFEGWEKTTVQQCLDECNRELGVRERIYLDWIAKDKISASDAKDRIQRMCQTCAILNYIMSNEGLMNTVEADMSTANAAPAQDKKPF